MYFNSFIAENGPAMVDILTNFCLSQASRNVQVSYFAIKIMKTGSEPSRSPELN